MARMLGIIMSAGSFLYAAVPGIRNYVELGGIGLLVFDRDDGYKLVKRICR